MSRILAIDFEGSHKDQSRGCPIQIGAAIMDADDVLSTFESLIKPPVHYKTGKPTREVDAYALAISGISLDQLDSAPDAAAVCEAFDNWVRANDARLLRTVAFNAQYDMEAYGNMLFQGGQFDFNAKMHLPHPPILSGYWVCARQLSQRLRPIAGSYHSLDDVCAKFGLSREGEKHGALEDAILAGRVYGQLSAKVEATA